MHQRRRQKEKDTTRLWHLHQGLKSNKDPERSWKHACFYEDKKPVTIYE